MAVFFRGKISLFVLLGDSSGKFFYVTAFLFGVLFFDSPSNKFLLKII